VLSVRHAANTLVRSCCNLATVTPWLRQRSLPVL
jgi:hypothetical protein